MKIGSANPLGFIRSPINYDARRSFVYWTFRKEVNLIATIYTIGVAEKNVRSSDVLQNGEKCTLNESTFAQIAQLLHSKVNANRIHYMRWWAELISAIGDLQTRWPIAVPFKRTMQICFLYARKWLAHFDKYRVTAVCLIDANNCHIRYVHSPLLLRLLFTNCCDFRIQHKS